MYIHPAASTYSGSTFLVPGMAKVVEVAPLVGSRYREVSFVCRLGCSELQFLLLVV